MFKAVNLLVDTAVRSTINLFLSDFFENLSSANFQDLRVGTTGIHVALQGLVLKRTLGNELLKNTPFKLLHAGLDRVQAELVLSTRKARRLLLHEVQAVLEFDPDWVPPPPTNDAPPAMPSGISGAAAIVYSATGSEELEDSFLRDDMKELLSKRNTSEEEGLTLPDNAADRSASAVAALLKELVHHSEVAVDGLAVRIRFPKSSQSTTATNKQQQQQEQQDNDENQVDRETTEVLIRFPSILIKDKTVFDGRPSDQFSKFVSIAPPVVQIYKLSKEEDRQRPVSGWRELSFEDTLLMGYGFLHASDEMSKERVSAFDTMNEERRSRGGGGGGGADGDNVSSSTKNNAASSSSSFTADGGMDFSSVMDKQRCVTVELLRRSYEPRVPMWEVKVSTTPFLFCARPYQVGLLLDIGTRIEQQSKKAAAAQEAYAAAAAAEAETGSQPSGRFMGSTFSHSAGGGQTTLAAAATAKSDSDRNNNSDVVSMNKARQGTFAISAKMQHAVIALLTSDDVVMAKKIWETIEDYDSFLGRDNAADDNNDDDDNINSAGDEPFVSLRSSNRVIPCCLADKVGFFAVSASNGRLLIEKNLSKQRVFFHNSDSGAGGVRSTASASSSSASPSISPAIIVGDTEIDRFLDRYTETTIRASLGSLVLVDRGSRNRSQCAVNVVELHSNNQSQGQPAAEFTFRATQAVPFHDVARSNNSAVDLSGVRYRHPTTSESYSRALLRSTVTVRDVRLSGAGRAVLRLEPTMLSRLVDYGNLLNDVTKAALIRNGVPLPKLAETAATKASSNNNNNNDNNNTSNDSRNMEEPFSDDATTASVSFQEIDIQCLLRRDRMPPPDIWGPLTCRFFDHLADSSSRSPSKTSSPVAPQEQQEGAAAVAAAATWQRLQKQLENQPNHLLPRSLVLRASKCGFTATPGTEPTMIKLSIGAADVLMVHEDDRPQATDSNNNNNNNNISGSRKKRNRKNNSVRTLLRVAPTSAAAAAAAVAALSISIAVKTKPFGVDDLNRRLDAIATTLARLPSSSFTGSSSNATDAHSRFIAEELNKQLSSIAVDIGIQRVQGVGPLLMDDLIFIMFVGTEMADIPAPLVKYVPLDETAASVALKSFVPNAVTSVNLRLSEVQCLIGAPRLDKHGVILGEPLSSLLEDDDDADNADHYRASVAPKNVAMALHRYELRATQLGLTLAIGAITPQTQHWGMHLGLGGFSLRDHQIQLDGYPGAVKLLCDSFADAHRRSMEGTSTSTANFAAAAAPSSSSNNIKRGSGRVLNVTLIRDTCYRKRSDVMQIMVAVECVSLVLQASAEGDAWPAVLAAWSADAPTRVKAGDRVHARGRVQKQDVIPLAAAITVNVAARDVLVDWKPEGRPERFAVLLSAVDCEIPELVTGDPKLTVTVRVPEQAALLLHNDFPTPIIEFDRAMFVSGINIFGSTRKGALEDLQYLGFVRLCTISPRLGGGGGGGSKKRAKNSNDNNNSGGTDSAATNNLPTVVIRKSHPGSSRKLQVEVQNFFTEISFAPDSLDTLRRIIDHVQDPKYIRRYVVAPVRLVRRAGGVYASVQQSVQPVEEVPFRAFIQDFDLLDDDAAAAAQLPSSSASSSMYGLRSDSNNTSRQQQQQRHHQYADPASRERHLQHVLSTEWELPDFDDSGVEKPNSFTFYNNNNNNNNNRGSVNNNDNDDDQEADHEQTQQLQQQQQPVPLLTALMSDLYYFKAPILDDTAVAEPLFNVPNSINFELLLHSCDFKVSFFAGADFAMYKPEHGHEDDDESGTSFHSVAHNTVPVFDVAERRQRLRMARNSSECVALWIVNCFVQLDAFPVPEIESEEILDEDGATTTEPAAASSSPNATQKSEQQQQQQQQWNPIRQLIFRAGDLELEDLVHDSPVRKMLYCALPKSQRDAPFITVRLRTLEKNVPLDDVSTFSNSNKSNSKIGKMHSHQASLRLLPVGLNVSARTVMRVVAAFLNPPPPQRNNEARNPILRRETSQSEAELSSAPSSSGIPSAISSMVHPPSAASLAAQESINNSSASIGREAGGSRQGSNPVGTHHHIHIPTLGGSHNSAAAYLPITSSAPVSQATFHSSTSPSFSRRGSASHQQQQQQQHQRFMQHQHQQDDGSQVAMRPANSASNLSASPISEPIMGSRIGSSESDHDRAEEAQTHQQQQQQDKPPVFFDKIILHPVDMRVSWFPDDSLNDKAVAEALGPHAYWLHYVVRFLAIEGARLSLSRIALSSVRVEDVSERVMVEAWPQLQSSKLLLLFAGLQPFRPVAEVAGAVGDLVLTPLEYWQHNRSVFVGIARGIQTCTSRLAAETLTLSATGTRLGHKMALAATQGLQRNPQKMLWGDQPRNASEGAVRALRSTEKGVINFGHGILFCVDEMKQSSVAGGLMRLPLSLLIPVEGVLRGVTEGLLGVRNSLRPEDKVRDAQEFKSSIFSHKKGDTDDDDDDNA